MEKSGLSIDVKEDSYDNGTKNSQVNSLERIFLIASFVLEIPTAVFDQLSSVHRPQYALLNMLVSFAVMIISIIDLVHRGRKARITWMKKGLLPWFYYPHANPKPFGTFIDIIGLVCSLFQWIFASIAYFFLCRHLDNPIKISIWPIIFSFCVLLQSKLSENYSQTRSTSYPRKLNIAKEFTLAEIAAATDNFSADNWVYERRLAVGYKGQLLDGREVLISRRVIGQGDKYKEEEKLYESALAVLSRLHHRNLVGLVGYCEEGAERHLVFHYAKNELLHTQLFVKDSSVIDSWVMRIKIALDAARGIDYLHNYAVPPIIHRVINSSSIWLTENWIARVADFRLAVMASESNQEYMSKWSAKEVNGYVDPEYYALNILTTKSDVYSYGVVLLELLTGKPAIFNDCDNGGKLTRLVDFVVPRILQNELVQVLDTRVGPPMSDNEAQAVEILAYTALHCVNSGGNNRPTMTDIVFNLEQALSLLMKIVQNSLPSG